MTRALSIVSSTGYQSTCTIFLAAGTYPTPNGTLFNGTPYGTHTGPVIISGATNTTAAWCDTVASVPTIKSFSYYTSGSHPVAPPPQPVPLYTFETIHSIPVHWTTSYGSINYYGGFTLTITSGADQGVNYTIAANTTFLNSNQFFIAYSTTVGPAPQFSVADTFCIYGPPLSIIEGSTDNAIWLSTNSFAHTLENVQVQAYSAGTGKLQLQGVNWALSNVWLTGQYGSGATQTGIAVTASAGSVLSAGVVTGVGRQGMFLGLLPTTAFTQSGGGSNLLGPSPADYQQSSLVLGTNSTATLQNSVFRSGVLSATTSTSTASVAASMQWANGAFAATASGASITLTQCFEQVRLDAMVTYNLQHNATGGGVLTADTVSSLGRVQVPSSCYASTPTGCVSSVLLISGSSSSSITLNNSTLYFGAVGSGSVTAGSMTVTNVSTIGTAPESTLSSTSTTLITVTGSSSSLTVTGASTVADYLLDDADTIDALAGATVTVTGASTFTVTHLGPGGGYSLEGSGSGTNLYVNGGSTFASCPDSCVNVDTSAHLTVNNATFVGASNINGVSMSSATASFHHTNVGVAPLYLFMSSSSTVTETYGTNLGDDGSAQVITLCGALHSWHDVDQAGSGGITHDGCTITEV